MLSVDSLTTSPLAELDGADAFAINAWVRSWFQAGAAGVDKGVYHSDNGFPAVARACVARGEVSILHIQDNPLLFLGFVASRPGQLHYVYIKKNFRRKGYAKWLLDTHAPGEATYSLRPSSGWKRDMLARYGYQWNPYALMLQETDDGQKPTADTE